MPASSRSADHPVELDPRRRKLLDAALGVFLRYGFRKTSMDEVARAAGVSRQSLYLHFSTKETLFRATVQHALDDSFQAASACLTQASAPLEQQLIGAFDAWIGRYVGSMGAGVSDLGEATHTLVGPLIEEREQRFVEAVARCMRAAGLVAAYKPLGLSAQKLAETLHATARGLKYGTTVRAEFVEGMRVAIRVMCLPLQGTA